MKTYKTYISISSIEPADRDYFESLAEKEDKKKCDVFHEAIEALKEKKNQKLFNQGAA